MPGAGGPPAFSDLCLFGIAASGFISVYLHGHCLVCDDPMVIWLVGLRDFLECSFSMAINGSADLCLGLRVHGVHACTALSLLGFSQWHLMHRHDRLVNQEAQIGYRVLARSPSSPSFGGLG